MTTELLTRKQLLAELKRSAPYLRAMERHGFEMPNGMASLADALDWLRDHKFPLSKKQKFSKISY